jgi:Fe-Mn family superoxide dismutase
MNILKNTVFITLLLLVFAACNNKKLTEVVEVPLPKAEEKMTIGDPDDIHAEEGSFELQELGYRYDELAPNLDAMTMELHYAKHYLAYANALNKAIDSTEFEKLSIEEILTKLDVNDENLKNNAGGYYNHGIYWESISPKLNLFPKDTLEASLKKDFGSFESFKTQFMAAANKHFGSGWAWLVVDKSGKLVITTTENQDNPLMSNAIVKGTPILGIDLWEHAYYLNYQQKKKNYITAVMKVIKWKKVGEKYEESLLKKY